MDDTIMLPQGQNGLVHTAGGRHHDHSKDFFLLQAIKDAHIETAKVALDVKNHVTVEAGHTRLLVAESSRRTEDLVRGIEAGNVRAQLQDAKDEVTTLKVLAAAKPAV